MLELVLCQEKSTHPLNNKNLSLFWSCSTDQLITQLPIYELLLRSTTKLRILIYSGDVDAMVPTLATQVWINKLNLPVRVLPWLLIPSIDQRYECICC